MKLNRREFTTTDTSGREFKCKAYYSVEKVWDSVNRCLKENRHDVYTSMGFEENTLDDLKSVIGNM